ncbi:cupin domain-containing protein [Variovorax sp. YR216]|uniref:cupin domain-containing protein n=1 Tax=Variovorax sp. YR216 TaxID=1882828 RepID=UPI00089BA770|nr:cupin domain-containing protein [Variovorax sp. YR216]SEB15943.1 Cupin domain-containing protein [Variovorax sp. YR216]
MTLPMIHRVVTGHDAQGNAVVASDGAPELHARSADALREGFSEIGDAGASTGGGGAPHPLMHRTESVDYSVVIEGEITLVLDKTEVPLKTGSVVIQRGTNHAWANRSGRPCRMLFLLVDGAFDPQIAQAISARGRGSDITLHGRLTQL